MLDLAHATNDIFEATLGNQYELADGDQLTLIAVQKLKSPSPRAQPFVLTFSHPTRALAQAIYKLKHESLGEMQIFLVPIQPDSRGRLFEAVFN